MYLRRWKQETKRELRSEMSWKMAALLIGLYNYRMPNRKLVYSYDN
jgi:hypothetical protein